MKISRLRACRFDAGRGDGSNYILICCHIWLQRPLPCATPSEVAGNQVGLELNAADQKYLNIVLTPIRVCAAYKPKFGQGLGDGLTVEQFQGLYQGDTFYAGFGLDNPLMYAAHKAAGGMTSVSHPG